MKLDAETIAAIAVFGDGGGGYPEPTGTITITQNGTVNVKDYAAATVNVSGGGDDWKSLADYIQSNGTQYINTGVTVKDNTHFECVANISSPNTKWGVLFGCRVGLNNGAVFFGIYGDNMKSWVVPFGSSQVELVAGAVMSALYNNKAVYELDITGFGAYNQWYIAGGDTYGNSVSHTVPVALFAINDNGIFNSNISCKLYRFRIYEGGTLVMELVPAKDGNNVVCMRDTVSGNYYYNSGTGVFVYGSDDT